ncbi:GRF1-interacting factor 3 [Hibiscus syriacus]|uniref:GRF1-interacting factor 3 n=1 Tax=Hibiscus syriacus TaxID=106335 RepID=A0A6A3BRZ8_HIBSY|nr:GRF1-interacting factor 3 [Hibiscus syriacus]
MQQPPQLMNITTEQIQKYLDENKELIMAIMENQNQGKMAESTSPPIGWRIFEIEFFTRNIILGYQARLQQNLMYLAKIADAQPQGSASSQMPQQPAMQQEQHVQSSQAVMAKQHSGFLAPKLPYHLNDQQQQQQQPEQTMYLQQQQLNQPQVGLRSAAPGGTYHGVQAGIGNNFMNIQGNRQDSSEDGAGEGFRNSAYGQR